MAATSTTPYRLNLGCGHRPLPGYVNIDSYATEADVVGDIRELSFTQIDEVLMSHVLEHISWREVAAVLERVHSFMRPGGFLRVEVPDMQAITEDAMSNPDWIRYIYGSQEHEGEYHRTGFTKLSLGAALADALFMNIDVRRFRSRYKTRRGMPCLKATATAA